MPRTRSSGGATATGRCTSEALLFAIAKVNALSDIIGVLGGLVEDLETRISAVEGCIARLVSMVDPEGFKEINNALDMSEINNALDMSEEDANMAIRILNKNNVGEQRGGGVTRQVVVFVLALVLLRVLYVFPRAFDVFK
jgi:hypothetical protein